MKNMLKRLLSGVVALAMVVAMMPTGALAVEVPIRPAGESYDECVCTEHSGAVHFYAQVITVAMDIEGPVVWGILYQSGEVCYEYYSIGDFGEFVEGWYYLDNDHYIRCSGHPVRHLTYVTLSGVKYKCDEDTHTATVTSISDTSSTALSIPAKVEVGGETYTVTTIGKKAFSRCEFISVTIPDSVTSIEALAFDACYEIEITFLAMPDNIAPDAFEDLYGARVNIPENWDLNVHNFDNYGMVGCTINRILPPPVFVPSLIFKKDYTDRYADAPAEGEAPAKTTAPNEELTFTIEPMDETSKITGFPTSVTMTVEDGVGEAEIAMPTEGLTVGEYWYTLKETKGKTAGVEYNSDTYYLHIIVGSKGGELGVKYATIHKTATNADTENWSQNENDTSDKIDTITNSYAEGTLTINMETSGTGAEDDEKFVAKVTLTLPAGTEITTDVTCGDIKLTPEDWDDDGVAVMEIPLYGKSDSVVIKGLPDGVQYKVELKEDNTEFGYSAPVYELDEDDKDDEDSIHDATADTPAYVTGKITNSNDTINISSDKTIPVDVGVILENGTYVMMGVAALAVVGFLFLSRNKKYEEE